MLSLGVVAPLPRLLVVCVGRASEGVVKIDFPLTGLDLQVVLADSEFIFESGARQHQYELVAAQVS